MGLKLAKARTYLRTFTFELQLWILCSCYVVL